MYIEMYHDAHLRLQEITQFDKFPSEMQNEIDEWVEQNLVDDKKTHLSAELLRRDILEHTGIPLSYQAFASVVQHFGFDCSSGLVNAGLCPTSKIENYRDRIKCYRAFEDMRSGKKAYILRAKRYNVDYEVDICRIEYSVFPSDKCVVAECYYAGMLGACGTHHTVSFDKKSGLGNTQRATYICLNVYELCVLREGLKEWEDEF